MGMNYMEKEVGTGNELRIAIEVFLRTNELKMTKEVNRQNELWSLMEVQ